MTDKEQKNAAKKFAEYWKDKGYEKGESQPFWLPNIAERSCLLTRVRWNGWIAIDCQRLTRLMILRT